jgi:NifB/MoaA-like Fe-S oxidoreductase
MTEAVHRVNAATGAELQVEIIENGYFGPEINVSGLLTGSDIVAALRTKVDGAPVYLSSRTISDRTQTMLDDMTLADVAEALNTPVVPALTFTDVIRDLKARTINRQAA